jgi:putative ABC transport system permease protein
VIMILLFIPLFNQLTGKSFDSTLLFEYNFIAILSILFIGGSVITGTYPAFVLSSFRPMTVLKGSLQHSIGGSFVRKSLVVGQFMASVILIAGTIIVANQLRHLQSIDLGIDIDNTGDKST